MSENRDCTSFLGVHVAERVLSHIFANVKRMPYGNPGYDFICRYDKMIDVKSACCRPRENHADSWIFVINRNHLADYFLMLAFDNRDDLNPEHVWLVPGGVINDHVSVGISETTLAKWAQYEQRLDDIIACCDVLRGD